METTSKLLPAAETERAMKVQEVILKAMAGSLKWWEAAEIIGISDRSLRRWRERYEEFGYDGLFDRRLEFGRFTRLRTDQVTPN